jgi:hypothetical protein
MLSPDDPSDDIYFSFSAFVDPTNSSVLPKLPSALLAGTMYEYLARTTATRASL